MKTMSKEKTQCRVAESKNNLISAHFTKYRVNHYIYLSRAVAVTHDVGMNVFLCEGVSTSLRLSGKLEHSFVVDFQSREAPELQCVDKPSSVKSDWRKKKDEK